MAATMGEVLDAIRAGHESADDLCAALPHLTRREIVSTLAHLRKAHKVRRHSPAQITAHTHRWLYRAVPA